MPLRTYLDHNATAPLRPEARQAMMAALDSVGNPSSIHTEGRAVRAIVETAREQVAALVGAHPKQVIFTSGGTEANNLALTPSLQRAGGSPALRLLVGATEHLSVLNGHRFDAGQVDILPVDAQGLLRLDRLEAYLDALQGEPFLLSLQFANSETGAIQPVAQVARMVHEAGGLIHSDAVQAAGRISIDQAASKIDAVSLSAHKLGGPKGIGALILADGISCESLIRGGEQERGRRGGTENVAGIAGFGAAAVVALRDWPQDMARIRTLRETLEGALKSLSADLVVFSETAERLPNTLSFAVPGFKAETLLIALDLAGIAASSGSACSSGKVRRSHVLEAMGIDIIYMEGAIRISFGWNSTETDGIACLEALKTLIKPSSIRAA